MKLRLIIVRQEVRMRSRIKVVVLIIEIMVPQLRINLNPSAEIQMNSTIGINYWDSKLDT